MSSTPGSDVFWNSCTALLPSITNFSIQYNFGCAGIATEIMLSHQGQYGAEFSPDFPQPMWAKRYLLSLVFFGSIFGMLVMGTLGDIIGARRALTLTNVLTVLGVTISAFGSWGSPQSVWRSIALGRIVLGFGLGGGYPLSAAVAAQQTSDQNNNRESLEKAVNAFVWQGPGAMSPYIAALLLLQLPASPAITSYRFRTLLGLGALPPLAVVLISALAPPPEAMPVTTPGRGRGRVVWTALRQPQHWMALIGTAGTWFLFDVVIYSLLIFAPRIIVQLVGESASLIDIGMRAGFIATLLTLGTVGGVWLVRYMGVEAKALTTWGLFASCPLFIALSFVLATSPDQHALLFALLCAAMVTLNMGPNVGTFVMPVVAFPQEVRGTFGGISSASGKAGAMLGAMLFPLVDEKYGLSAAFALNGIICAVGALWAAACFYDFTDSQDSKVPLAPAERSKSCASYGL